MQGLSNTDLRFQTLPINGFDERLDFILMSCHNPETKKALEDGADGFAVWAQMTEIMVQNGEVRFALLAGDQIYADHDCDFEKQVLAEPGLRKRQELYLDTYRKFWDNIYYRKVLCRIPAILMWDDHDITDGWGSREDSFEEGQPTHFKPEWLRMFEAARSVFLHMQAVRNPDPLSKNYEHGFDMCFKIGRAGFVIPDLRSNRNVHEPRIMLPEQLDSIKQWVEARKDAIDILFFVSTVVFSHGDPGLDNYAVVKWPLVLRFAAWLAKFSRFKGEITSFNTNVGDLRDDINDSWGSEPNREEADRVLDFLFGLQNPQDNSKPLNVVILSGDIHTPGHSVLYSANSDHQGKAVIPHVVATPVAYEPSNWIVEAVYRHLTRVSTPTEI